MQSKTKQLLARLEKVECPDTTTISDHFPIVMKRAKGLKVVDVEDKTYLDFTSCFGVLALGHSSPVVTHTLQKQMKKIIHGMGDVHPTVEKIQLLELLAKVSPYTSAKSLLGLSGGDAVEAALKTAMLATERYQFLTLDGGYHGLQFGPLSLNHRSIFTSGFENWIRGRSVSLPFPYFPAEYICEKQRPDLEFFKQKHHLQNPETVLQLLEEELKKKIYAAFVLEPIQGRGGKRALSPSFLKSSQELCKKYGTLLIFDEIYSGFGRTGKMFAWEHSGVVPDLMCVGKALGGGLPLSACTGEILDVWGKSNGEARHTQTFLGHPLACAVAYKHVLEIKKKLPFFIEELYAIEKEFQFFSQKMQEKGLIEKYPFEIRGQGFMRGIWFYTQNEGFCVPMMEFLLKEGFLVLPEGERADVLSLTPPLVSKAMHFKQLLKKVIRYLENLE